MRRHAEQEQFGKRLAKLRRAKALSQEALAELAELHRNYVGGTERGERNLGLRNIVRLARVLGVTPSELLRGLK
jgi:transcriptional regulator with XRE-family HTH domain